MEFVLSPIERVPVWRIGECLPDMEGTGEIKYPARTKMAHPVASDPYWAAIKDGNCSRLDGHPRRDQLRSRGEGNCSREGKQTIGKENLNSTRERFPLITNFYVECRL